jgi:hypothetical protein
MRPFLSRALVKKGHIVTYLQFDCLCSQSVAKAEYRHCQTARSHRQLLRKDGSMSAVALGVGLGSLAPRGWHPSSSVVGDPQLRQSYIRPHCPQCPPVSRKLLLWRPPLRALRVKATGVMQNCLRWSGLVSRRRSTVCPSPTRRRLSPLWCAGTRASVRRCARVALVSGLRPCILCVPRPPLGLACFAASPARSARPPPRGSLQCRAGVTPPDGGGLMASHRWQMRYHRALPHLKNFVTVTKP